MEFHSNVLAPHAKKRMVKSAAQAATVRREMPFFCYIHRRDNGVPHFEVLAELTEQGAHDRAAQLLAQRVDGDRAEVWEGDTLLFTLPKAGAVVGAVS